MRGSRTLALAGALSATVAALHVVIVLVGVPGYRYFGAPEEIVRQAAAGSLFPAAVTLSIGAVFVLFALYAFSGAGMIRRLPLLRTGLIVITTIYTLRGLGLLTELALYLRDSPLVAPRHMAFSFVSGAIGALYLVGTVRSWSRLKSPAAGR